jgi:hypothetical protein
MATDIIVVIGDGGELAAVRFSGDALPKRMKNHLIDRLRIREIDARDMTALLAWIKLNLNRPPWCKDFGTFKLAGEGPIPKTFLTKDQACTGERL